MRGKAGLVVGLAIGYVLGTRAGRERYEQIKTQWLRLWNTDPVQKQVTKAKEVAKSAALSLPSTLWDSAVKVGRAAASKRTAGQKLDAAVRAGARSADDIERAADTSARAVQDAAEDALDDVAKATGRGGD